jgi:ATP synthase protein I
MQQGVGVGFRTGIEFVVAVVVATGLGWAIDRWLGTRPWGTIVLFFLGVGAGMLSVYRAVAGIKMPVGSRPLDKIGGGRGAKNEWDDDEE